MDMACRPVGATTFTLLAAAPSSDVLFFTDESSTPHVANGAGWYYSDSFSWGFAREGDELNRYDCDVHTVNPADRLCWHSYSGQLDDGWRCGATTDLNFNSGWERVVFQAPGVL